MAMVKNTLKKGDKLSPEQKKMIDEAARRPTVFDEDSPKLTEEQMEQFRRISEVRAEERRKQNVTLRLSPATIRKAKALGKGYTGVLSRIIEGTLNDPQQLEKYL